ncbi:MAG: ABC transporter permease subunit [Bacteroidia bacterium]|nr:ABC transporter permease subunit [Bacteroidia bacterium]MDW8015615.1 ABC transporter permease subunit [Bacteroidia bacterium]
MSIGLLMGSQPGWVDRGLQIILQSIWVVPAILWASILAFIGGRNLLTILLAIGLSMWTETARLIRVEVRRLWGEPFVEAAKALGLPYLRIVLRHIIPVLTPLIRIQFLQAFATAILIEAGLGFVGLSLGPPATSLGILLFEAVGWLVLPQGQFQGIAAGLLLGGTVFAVYSLTGYGRHSLG